jgi:hypothetical protein
MIFFYISAAYFLLVFIVGRFIVPHLGFADDPVPESMPESMIKKIDELKTGAENSPRRFLELAYEYIGSKYHSERFNTVLKFHYLFKNIDQAWNAGGYIPCTLSNYILKIFLVKSGLFKESEIRRRHVFANFVPHQYLQIKIGGRWMAVDVGERKRGLKIGEHLWGFG